MAHSNVNLGCCSMTLKYLVFLFNLIFFLSGLILVILGGIAQGFFKEYIQFFDHEYKTPAMVLIILGILIMVVSFFGCCGARMESVCMLRTFATLLCVLLIVELIAGIAIAVMKSDIEEVVVHNMNRTMQEYGNTTLAMETWDDIQTNLHCCGTMGYMDWKETPFGNGTRVPDSCCVTRTQDCGKGVFTNATAPAGLHQNGCAASLKDAALKNLGLIIGSAVGIAVIQVIGIWMSCRLVRAVKEHYESL